MVVLESYLGENWKSFRNSMVVLECYLGESSSVIGIDFYNCKFGIIEVEVV